MDMGRDTMNTKSPLQWAFLFLLLASISGAQNGTSSPSTNDYKTVMYNSLGGLYPIVNNFIVGVTGNGILQPFLANLGLDVKTGSSNDFSNITLPSDVNGFISKVLPLAAGYVIILAIGIILTLFFMISCCCFSCFRKCGCCCGNVGKNEEKSSDLPLIVILFILVSGLTVLLCLSAYGSVASGTVAVTTLSQTDNETQLPIVGNLVSQLRQVSNFIKVSFKEINDVLNVTDLSNKVKSLTSGLSDIVKNELTNMSLCGSCSSLIMDLNNLSNATAHLKDNLKLLQSSEQILKGQYNALNKSVSELKTNATESIIGCLITNQTCQSLNLTLSIFFVLRDPNMFPDLSKLNQSLNKSENLAFDTSQFGNFSGAFDGVTNLTLSSLQSLKDELNGIQIDSYLDSFNQNFNTSGGLSLLGATIPWSTIKPILDGVVTGLKYGVPLVGVGFFIIVLLNIIGLILGPCCFKSSPTASQKVFVGSSQVTFVTCSTISILVALLFVIFTFYYREGCYDFEQKSSSVYFKFADRSIQQSIPANDFSFFNVTLKLNKSNLFVITNTIYKQCMQNNSLTTALFDIVTIDDNLANQIVSSLFEPLLNTSLNSVINISSLPIFSDEILKNINQTADSLDNSSVPDLPNYFMPGVNITTPVDLEDLKRKMQNASDVLSGNNKTVMDSLINTTIPSINLTIINITAEETKYISYLRNINSSISMLSSLLRNVSRDATAAKAEIQKDEIKIKANIISKVLDYTRIQLTKFILDLKNQLLGVAKCLPLYNFANTFLASACEIFINPLNAYWFTLGCCIILSIPSFLFGLWLSGLFARRGKSQSKSDDDDDSKSTESQQLKETPPIVPTTTDNKVTQGPLATPTTQTPASPSNVSPIYMTSSATATTPSSANYYPFTRPTAIPYRPAFARGPSGYGPRPGYGPPRMSSGFAPPFQQINQRRPWPGRNPGPSPFRFSPYY